MDAVVATDSWLVVVCVTVVATDSWLVVVYAMASVCCSQRSNRMRGVSARCVVCSGGLHASHQRHVATWLAHHAPHCTCGRTRQSLPAPQFSAARASDEAGGCGLVACASGSTCGAAPSAEIDGSSLFVLSPARERT